MSTGFLSIYISPKHADYVNNIPRNETSRRLSNFESMDKFGRLATEVKKIFPIHTYRTIIINFRNIPFRLKFIT